MTPCKHLDYDETKYGPDITLEHVRHISPEVRFWLRGQRWTDNGPNHPPNPSKVQFCKLRGRINDVFSCYTPGERSCYEV